MRLGLGASLFLLKLALRPALRKVGPAGVAIEGGGAAREMVDGGEDGGTAGLVVRDTGGGVVVGAG